MQKRIKIEICIHFIFWIIVGNFFVRYSFLRFNFVNYLNEILSLSMIIVIIYINLFFLIPLFLNKSKLYKYFSIILFLIGIITVIEFLIIKKDILTNYLKDSPKELQNGFLWLDFFTIFLRDTLFVGFFTMFQIYRNAIRSNKLLIEKTQLEEQKLKTEINMLKSKINSHFLLNTLNNLYALALDSAPETPIMIYKLRDLLRYIVVDCENEMLTIENEIEFINNYISLEKLRHDKLKILFNYDANILDMLIAPMLFESFINNAFKYTPKDGTGYVNIELSFERNENEIIFTCENNIIKNTTNIDSRGKGMKNTIERLEMLYNKKYILLNNIDEGIYKVKLILKDCF